MIGIYKITNKLNGKTYIGQTDNIERRLAEHKQKRKQTIDNYINVIGVENFDFEIIEECNIEELDEKEQYYINKYDTKENGYNYQDGGFNNSSGEGNGRAILTEADVIRIRTAYKNHEQPKKVFEKEFKKLGITKHSFQAVWQGRCWSNIMPEVFTEENKNYYIREMSRERNSIFSKEQVLKYRTYYINHTAKEVYELAKQDGIKVTLSTVQKMLSGDGKRNNFYKEIPIYSKKRKRWELNGEPVSTIPGSGE